MSWYYAENNERRGPLEDAAFDALIAAGSIKPDTLVWREGMASWTPLSAAGYQPAAAGIPAIPASEASTRTGEPMGMCSESGRILPRSELVEIDGRLVSAEYKNVVLQRIREGVGVSGSVEDPETIAQRIEDRGWQIDAGSCLSRGWALVKGRFGLAVGATFLVYLIIMAAGMIPFGSIVVQGPLIGGLYWMFLKMHRGQPAALEDAFQGFSRGWGHLVGATLITALGAMLCLAPGGILVIAGGVTATQDSLASISPMMIGGIVLLVIGAIAATYLTIAWAFGIMLVVDKRLECWPALKLSRRVVGMHWWSIFWLLLLTGLVILALLLLAAVVVGLVIALLAALSNEPGLAIGVGILLGLAVAFGFFAVLPIGFSALVVAYEDIFGDQARG